MASIQIVERPPTLAQYRELRESAGWRAIDFYLQDVIVHPDFQGMGVGAEMMERLLGFLGRAAQPGSFVGLMAAQGASAFYQRYGFAEREPGRPGMFKIWTENDPFTELSR